MAQASDELTRQGAEALAFFSIYDYDANRFAERVMNAVDIERVPVVLISWDDLRAPLPHLLYDNYYAGYQAAQLLLQNGCDQLIFLAPFYADWARQRIVGARWNRISRLSGSTTRSRVLGLTNLRPPLEDLGTEAARLLLQRLRGNVTSTQVRLCSHLVPRLSTQFKP